MIKVTIPKIQTHPFTVHKFERNRIYICVKTNSSYKEWLNALVWQDTYNSIFNCEGVKEGEDGIMKDLCFTEDFLFVEAPKGTKIEEIVQRVIIENK